MMTKRLRRAALYLGLVSAGVVGILCISRSAVAQGCINYWINPRTGVRECLDGSQPPSVPGSGTGTLESSPIPPFNVGRTRFEYRHTNAFAALKNDGSVVTWGGVGGDSSRVRGQLSNGVTQLYSNQNAFAALKQDGSVVTWGDGSFGGNSIAVATQLQKVQQIVALLHE